MIDPGRTHAIVLGLERYDHGQAMDLPGPARDAVRFARWVLACGVPKEQVWVGLSRLDTAELDSAPPAGTRPIGTTNEDVRKVFLQDLLGESGSLLLVYWSGHGIVNDQRERALFTSDAIAADKRNVLLGQLLTHLSSRAIAFDRQLVVVDACANFASDMRWDARLPRDDWPLEDPAARDQVALVSAAQGQIAATNRTERYGEFSKAILDSLAPPGGPPMGLPPDVNALTAAAHTAFAALRSAGRTRQTPVLFVRHYRLDPVEELVLGGFPVPGEVQQAASAHGLSPAQLGWVARAIGRCAEELDADARRALVDAVDGFVVPVQPAVSDVEAAAFRALSMAPDGGRSFFKALNEQAADNEHLRLRVQEAEIEWSYQREIAPVCGRLAGKVTPRMVAESYVRTVPDGDPDPPTDLDHALHRASTFRTNHRRPLVRLVAALEHAAGVQVEDHWFGLTPDALAALRNAERPPVMAVSRLMIDLRTKGDVPDAKWPDEVEAILRDGRAVPQRRLERCDKSLEGTRAAVAKLVAWASGLTMGRLLVGLLIGRSALYARPETWDYSPPFDDPVPLSREFPTTLHCAERLTLQSVRDAWQTRGQRIDQACARGEPATVGWIRPDERNAQRIRNRLYGSDDALVGLQFVPEAAPPSLKGDPVLAAIAVGAPYIFWADPAFEDWADAQQEVEAVLTTGELSEFPVRLQVKRLADDAVASRLRLIWDDPGLSEFAELFPTHLGTIGSGDD